MFMSLSLKEKNQDVINQAIRELQRAANIDTPTVTLVGDTNYNIMTTDNTINNSASLTAPRTWTLPLVSAVTPGQTLRLLGSQCSPTNTLTLACSGSDHFYDASASSFPTTLVLKRANTLLTLIPLTNGGGSYWSVSWQAQEPDNYIWVDLNATSQTGIPSATYTKVLWSRINSDIDGTFDAVTNHRYTPNRAGHYLLSATVEGQVTSADNIIGMACAFAVNGGIVFQSSFAGVAAAAGFTNLGSTVSVIVGLNGSTDYVEVQVYIGTSDGATSEVLGSASNTYWTARRLGP